MSTDNEQLATEFFDALYGGDLDAVLERMSDDVEWWLIGLLPASGRYVGKEAIVNELLAPFEPVWEERTQTHEVCNLFSANDHVLVELIGGGETAHGNQYRNIYCYVLRVADGKITRVRGYTDTGYALGLLWGPQRAFPAFD
jgi:uncharacterized protein